MKRAKTKVVLHPDGLLAAKAVAPVGGCLFCEEPLPPKPRGQRGRPRIMCGRRGCTNSYINAWKRDAGRLGPKKLEMVPLPRHVVALLCGLLLEPR